MYVTSYDTPSSKTSRVQGTWVREVIDALDRVLSLKLDCAENLPSLLSDSSSPDQTQQPARYSKLRTLRCLSFDSTYMQAAGREKNPHRHTHTQLQTVTCTYVRTYVRTCIHTCKHAYMHPCMHACIHAYMHTCIHACANEQTHTYIYIHTCKYVNMYSNIYTHTYIHIYIYTYIHTFSYIPIGLKWSSTCLYL